VGRYVLALDQGTTSSRAILFDSEGDICGIAQRELSQGFPHPGWVEHDPEEIWASQVETGREVLQTAAVSSQEVAAIGVTNQRETTIVWDRRTGKAIYPAIVWQDRRTAADCDALRETGQSARVEEITGLVVDSYFSATKLAWLLKHVGRSDHENLAFGTVDSFLLWRLTGGKVHATDVTNASRTMLFDIARGEWSDELLDLFQIPKQMLPEVRDTSCEFGTTSEFGSTLPVLSLVGDQHAATFGQACFRPGMAKATFGTGCFLLEHVGTQPVRSKHRLLTTPTWRLNGQTEFALEGSVFVAGAAVQWLRDQMGFIATSDESELVARSVPDTAGVYVVPAFVGLGAPYWDQHARGTIVGLTRGAGKAQIVRATLDGIAYQCKDVVEAMQSDSGVRLGELRVDGGACRNDYLLQFQADILGVPVVRPTVLETTALGAAYLAGLQAGVWADRAELESHWQADRTFTPSISTEEREEKYGKWREAVARSRNWDAAR